MLVLTMGTAMVVTVIGLSAVWASRMRLRDVQASTQILEALGYAQSAIELGLLQVRSDPNWRTTLGAGMWVANQSIGHGTCTLTTSIVADGDADPYNDDWLLLGTGISGDAVRKIELTLVDGKLVGEWKQKVD